MRAFGIGVVGCGNISPIYLQTLGKFEATNLLAVADLDLDRAKARAAEYGVPRACSVEDLLADPEIDVVVNLTVPKAHYSVSKQALEAGKHVYNEKPLCVTAAEARELEQLAQAKGLRVGCAPDTVLGAGVQTCRKLIDDGAIGQVIGGNAFMMCAGHESWHPSPEFYYEVGGGPMLDMGPYYLSALHTLLGPVARVQGSARISFPTRTITSEPKKGKIVEVETPTHLVGVLDYAAGPVVQITTSFDVKAHRMPCIELYGSEGTITVPDPNGFGGPVKLNKSWGEGEEIELTHGFAENSRGLGVLDMVYAIANDRPHRASGAMGLHLLEVMEGLLSASKTGQAAVPASQAARPEPMAADNSPTALVG